MQKASPSAGLSRFPYLSVVSSHSTRALKSGSADVRRLGETLGARYVLDGGLRRAGSGLRIAVRLVDAQTGAQLWSETYSRNLPGLDALAIQDDVTDRLVATVADVHGVLLRSMSQGLHDRPIDELSASELALRYWPTNGSTRRPSIVSYAPRSNSLSHSGRTWPRRGPHSRISTVMSTRTGSTSSLTAWAARIVH